MRDETSFDYLKKKWILNRSYNQISLGKTNSEKEGTPLDRVTANGLQWVACNEAGRIRFGFTSSSEDR